MLSHKKRLDKVTKKLVNSIYKLNFNEGIN